MNYAPWVPPSSAQVAVCIVCVPPLILWILPCWTWTSSIYSGLYHLHLCITWLIISLKNLGCHEIAPYVSSTACMNQPHLHKLHDYCTVFRPSFAQVWHQLHKLPNKNNIFNGKHLRRRFIYLTVLCDHTYLFPSSALRCSISYPYILLHFQWFYLTCNYIHHPIL